MNVFSSYDECFNEILVSYQNASPSADVSKGSELYVRAAGLASCVWGLVRLLQWTYRQMFPTTADPETRERYGIEIGVVKQDGESWEQFLERLLGIYRNASGGGNKTDVEAWAMGVVVDGERASNVTCYPAKFGPGTSVLLVTKASGQPSQALLDRIVEVVLENGPVVPAEVYALAPTTRPVTLSIAMNGGSVSQASSLITSYIASLLPGQPLIPVVLQAMCIQAGAVPTPVITPATEVIPGPFEKIVLNGAIQWL